MKIVVSLLLLNLFISWNYAHVQISVTRVEFETTEKRHCYNSFSLIQFKSIALETKFLVSGAGLETFSPKAGIKKLKSEAKVSVFVKEKGFDWGYFQYPKDFGVYTENSNSGEYSGIAVSLPKSAPWFMDEYNLRLEIRDSQNNVLETLHQGKLQDSRCFVEYIADGLKNKQLNSHDNTCDSALSMIRAVIAMKNFQYKAPEKPGFYQLYAEFKNADGVFLGNGIYNFEVNNQTISEINLFGKVSATPIMEKGKTSKIRLELRDSQGKLITSPQHGYIRQLAITIKKENVPTMTDPIIRDFHWVPLPPTIKAKLPLEIPFNDSWLEYFGSGEVHFSFTITREYIKKETLEVSGNFLIKL